MKLPAMPEIISRLQEMQNDELIILEKDLLKVTNKVRTFIRNIAMAFDLRMVRNQPESRIFSMTI